MFMGVPAAPRLFVGRPNGPPSSFFKVFYFKTETSFFFKPKEKWNAGFSKTCFFQFRKKGRSGFDKIERNDVSFFHLVLNLVTAFISKTDWVPSAPRNARLIPRKRKNCKHCGHFYTNNPFSIKKPFSIIPMPTKKVITENIDRTCFWLMRCAFLALNPASKIPGTVKEIHIMRLT